MKNRKQVEVKISGVSNCSARLNTYSTTFDFVKYSKTKTVEENHIQIITRVFEYHQKNEPDYKQH